MDTGQLERSQPNDSHSMAMRKPSKRSHSRDSIPLKDRQLEDIDRDLEALGDEGLLRTCTSFIRTPENTATSIRLIRHLIAEPIPRHDSSLGIAQAFHWIIKAWPYDSANDMFKAFIGEIQATGKLENGKWAKDAADREAEFRKLVRPVLHSKLILQLQKADRWQQDILDSMLETVPPPKRMRHSDLPPIPEEERSTE